MKSIKLSEQVKNIAKKKVEKILIVQKSTRFDRLAGLNRVAMKDAP